tara:strand:- start:523 stop:876 length:354 start_codon:yes stop_codon:yes gene_type:complete
MGARARACLRLSVRRLVEPLGAAVAKAAFPPCIPWLGRRRAWILALWSNSSIRNFPKRELLSLRSVLAQPKASVIGCEPWMRSSSSFGPFETNRRYCSKKRALSVLPAPDSPLITIA